MKFDAILFDCDGVLVDSEQITNGVLREMMAELGWHLSPKEGMAVFLGKALEDLAPFLSEKTGHTIDAAWIAQFRVRRNVALKASLQPIEHIEAALTQIQKIYGTRMACASGADRAKVELQLGKTGLLHFFEGRIFSGLEMPRNKPNPDIYLAAAKALGADPLRCAVIEDSTTGARAGVAAGCSVHAYAPDESGHSSAEAMRAVGVKHVFTSMAQLPALLT